MDKIKVLIVDDSSYMRYLINKILMLHPKIEVIDTARDGVEALEKIKKLKPDVVTLDIEMPELDGIGVLKKLKEENIFLPIVVVSKLAEEGAEVTLKALELGAVDFITKPKGGTTEPLTLDKVKKELIRKVEIASKIEPEKLKNLHRGINERGKIIKNYLKKDIDEIKKVIVITASTGGPTALHEVIPKLPGDIPAYIFVIQHMPSGFTKSLADKLNLLSEIEVKEAENREKIRPAVAFVAPGGYHMEINEFDNIILTTKPPVNGVRPSADVTMECIAKKYGKKSVGVVLTGMGYDGTKGCYLIKKAGGKNIAEDISTAIVDGMPSSLIKSGHCDVIAPLPKIAEEIIKIVEED